MSAVVQLSFMVAAALAVARILRPGTLADRVIGFDTLLLVLVALVAKDAAVNQRTHNLDLLLVITLLGFLGTITASAYLERRGLAGEDDDGATDPRRRWHG